MEDFNSKYTGEQVEELLDMVANGEVGGGIEEETDPIFSASPAASITEAKKAEWDGKQDAIADLATIRSGAEKGATALQEHQDISGKQDVITDLATIREGASKGATALQSIPEEYVTESELSAKGYATTTQLDGKVDKVDGKQLSAEDFTSELKSKLETLSNYDDTELSNALATLREDFDKLVSGDTTTAIKTFNEVIAFLDGIADTEDLAGIIASIEQQIASKADDSLVLHKADTETITGVKTFNGRVNFLGSGDSNAMYLSTNTRLNVNGTTNTVLGFSSGTFLINNAAYDLTLRGKGARPNYNNVTLALSSDVAAKQDTLVSGTNIKTINGTSILGSGDITIEGGGATLTEADIAAMGFTKNTGTYSKPSGGIPKSDLASAVQSSLGKADTALQSYTEQYKGTVTGVKVNGSTKSPSSGTVDIGNVVTSVKINGSSKTPSSGVVDLGTVITSHQDISGKQDKLVSGTNIKTINNTSILGSGNISITGGSGTITGVSANGTSIATSGVANIPAASTSKYGVTKLSSATNSTSTTLAATASAVKSAYDLANGKQDKLVSGTNIKTINGTSILGSGNITISGGGGGTSGGGKEFVEIEPSFSPMGYEGSFGGDVPMQPNKVYVFTEALMLLYINGIETSSAIGDEYTIMFTADRADIVISITDEMQVYWANGTIPPISAGDLCELSLVRIGSNIKAVLTTFKPA